MVTSNDRTARADEGNAYEFNACSALQLYGAFVEGDPNCTLVVASRGPLSPKARAALEASAERLGYGKGACAWVVMASDAGELGAGDVLSLVEGLDPVAIIAADADAASLLSSAFVVSLKLDAANRAACRTVVALSDFEASLQDDEAKQKAWAALKKLAR